MLLVSSDFVGGSSEFSFALGLTLSNKDRLQACTTLIARLIVCKVSSHANESGIPYVFLMI